MEEIKVLIEVEGKAEQDDRFEIQDAITDALEKLGFRIISVRVRL